MTDIVFAVDSVPAIFGLTREPLVVFTSNIFAILGLRNLYFLLAGAVDKFHLLKYGLGIVLVFVGPQDDGPQPPAAAAISRSASSLGIIVGVIARLDRAVAPLPEAAPRRSSLADHGKRTRHQGDHPEGPRTTRSGTWTWC